MIEYKTKEVLVQLYWSPCLRKLAPAIERVWQRFIKLVSTMTGLIHKDRLRRWSLCSLELRWRRGDLNKYTKLLQDLAGWTRRMFPLLRSQQSRTEMKRNIFTQKVKVLNSPAWRLHCWNSQQRLRSGRNQGIWTHSKKTALRSIMILMNGRTGL